ncbi:AAA domain-containing protein [Nonlabens sp. Ci31]|jgi:hypothetical protein|uniref:AAA family ATPase n=1 Tax=Nonlabens sp. Ci31 TaxID=2608253 RepID=UPI00146339E1|nr:AAA family ATPase [Nonlabens sp. Ci31]QJP34337.1 AAA domain-containing protein [Nonlabens sp. Ci31]
MNKIKNFHFTVYEYLIAYHAVNPSFTFLTRKRDSKKYKKEDGYILVGNDDYATAGLVNRKGANLSSRAISLFFVKTGENSFDVKLDINYNDDLNATDKNALDQLVSRLNLESNDTRQQVAVAQVKDDDTNQLFEYLNRFYPILLNWSESSETKDFLVSKTEFKKLTKKIKPYLKSNQQELPQLILVNLTWNSKDWKEPSVDISNHGYVKEGNVPGESWNFQVDAPWNDEDYLYGYAQFTNEPTIKDNLLLIFYSQGKIVGFYGDAQIGNFTEEAFKNLSGDRALSFVLENKIDGIKEKGFLEDKERIGQIGFTYLQESVTFDVIVEEAIRLNPNQALQLDHLKTWYYSGATPSDTQEDMDELMSALRQLSKQQIKDYFKHLELLKDEFKLNINDERIVFNIAQGNLNFHIGQRYVFNLSFEKTSKIYGVISKNKLNENSEAFKDNPESTYFNYYLENLQNFTVLEDHFIAVKEELDATIKCSRLKFDNPFFREMVFNTPFRNEVYQKLFDSNQSSMINPNTILYGPPGTGKTYLTIAKAVALVDPDFYNINKDDREKIGNRYQELLISNWEKTTGQIAFTTFHQSFTYEDFVEGIKPVMESDDLKYKVEDGILKKMCLLAKGSSSIDELQTDGELSWDENTFEQSLFYKLSLGEAANPEDDIIYEYCINNNLITLGFIREVDLTGKSQSQIREISSDNDRSIAAAQMLNTFVHGLQEDDYIVISKGNRIVRALGKITGGYFYDPNSEIEYAHFRKVEWIFKDQEVPSKEIYRNSLTQRSLYKLDQSLIKKDFFVKSATAINIETDVDQPYILIIDEINRGNVASIFGELITLIETDKRAGAENELSVILPYSKTKFSVPSNLHIIGTMNTADRSIEALDSALRRRFEFIEMLPDYDVIDKELNQMDFEGYQLSAILKIINNRITILIDRDHQIGHSYFLKLKHSADLEKNLKSVFKNKIIPLLQEYFFNDYVKIAMVIGEGFMDKDQYSKVTFATSDGDYASDYDGVVRYEIKKDFEMSKAIMQLMGDTVDE